MPGKYLVQEGHRFGSYAGLLERVPLPRAPRDIKDRTPELPRVFSTTFYDPADQFVVWKERISAWSDVSLPEGAAAADGFEIEFMACNMADIAFSSGFYAAQSLKRVADPTRCVGYWWLFHLRSGEAWLESGGRQMHARPGAMFLLSLDQDYAGRVTDCEGLLLGLPRQAFTAVAEEFDNLCNTILFGNLNELLADYLRHLEMRVVHMNLDELQQAGRATVEMISACIQPSPDRREQALGAIESVIFERASRYIQSHLGEFDLSPERIAQQLRISRSNLYRAFEHVGGVARFIMRTRLRAAHAELLAANDRQVQEIAYRYGFKLGSDFARAFRREFGYSPREARERGRR